jgi:uncharacterized membrane protein YfcA
MPVPEILTALVCGVFVGLSLGVIGGGGSVLAVPMMVYVIGIGSPHVAIGTSSVAVAASALLSLSGHARAHNVKWPCATVFAAAGIAGAAAGAGLGKAVDGTKLLIAFGLLMIVIAALMVRPRRGGDRPDVQLRPDTARSLLPPLAGTGFGVGALSGFFGIGGGFLIVPGLVGATAMPLLNAVGSSLVAVTAFGATTAISYAVSGLVDWPVAGLFILGGAIGGIVGIKIAGRLAGQKRALSLVFSTVVALVGIYVVVRGILAVIP